MAKTKLSFGSNSNGLYVMTHPRTTPASTPIGDAIRFVDRQMNSAPGKAAMDLAQKIPGPAGEIPPPPPATCAPVTCLHRPPLPALYPQLSSLTFSPLPNACLAISLTHSTCQAPSPVESKASTTWPTTAGWMLPRMV